MKKNTIHLSLIIIALLMIFLSSAPIEARSLMTKRGQTILLGETPVKINVYEKDGAGITFFAPHHNEKTAIKLTKAAVEKRGGKFVEIESFDASGSPSRRLNFKFNNKSYSLDPNRIFTANGRNCHGFSPEISSLIKKFADDLLGIIFPASGELPAGESFLVAVHNNSDADGKPMSARSADLSAAAFVGKINSQSFQTGEFQHQAAGVYLSNDERDSDNFIFLSAAEYISHFAARGFNVVVQKAAEQLRLDKRCAVDDGSLSVYAAVKNISYICLEADAENGALRQKQMLEAVYELIGEPLQPQAVFPEKLKSTRKSADEK